MTDRTPTGADRPRPSDYSAAGWRIHQRHLPYAERRAAVDAAHGRRDCTYPLCRCVVATSTTSPRPRCPRGLEQGR